MADAGLTQVGAENNYMKTIYAPSGYELSEFTNGKRSGWIYTTNGDVSKYSDAGSISSWALEVIKWANAEGLITGRTETTIVPTGTATRAEAATILMRFLENIAK